MKATVLEINGLFIEYKLTQERIDNLSKNGK